RARSGRYRCHSPSHDHVGPFVVGVGGLVELSSCGAESRPAVAPGSESGVNHGRVEVVAVVEGAGSAVRRRGTRKTGRGIPRWRMPPARGGLIRSTTAMPMRKTAAGTTTPSRIQKSV